LQTYAQVTYSLVVRDANDNYISNCTLYAAQGLDDAKCASLVQTLRDFAWPAGMTPVSVSAVKHDVTSIDSTCNTAVTPPTFS
jgi:hypothetical protein